MAHEIFLGGKVSLCCGDSLHFLRDQPGSRYDSIVTDPPYALVSITKRFGSNGSAPVKVPEGGSGAYARASAGFMGKKWDTGETAFAVEFWEQCLRVLKPGGHVVAFSGTRTYHRLACAIEDAGFEIRDMLQWLYGSGFPKSHAVSKGIDQTLGAERAKVRIDASQLKNPPNLVGGAVKGDDRPWRESAIARGFHEAVSDEAMEWQGWGTALKPACEPICFGRKPLIGTLAANVLQHGTGAINIDGCRVGTESTLVKRPSNSLGRMNDDGWIPKEGFNGSENGRWPANIVHDGSEEVLAAFPETASGANGIEIGADQNRTAYGVFSGGERSRTYDANSGSAARFFYQVAKDDIVSEEVIITWISDQEPCQAVLRVDTAQSLQRATVVSASIMSSAWSTFLSGNTLTVLFQQASTCIIRTKTNSTTDSKIWNYLTNLLTSESTVDVSYETVNGGSHAENAENEAGSIIITLAKTVSLLGVSHAASGTRLKISVNVNSQPSHPSASRLFYGSKAAADDRLGARHPTIKPIDLMQWLVRLVTPKGGLVLDPFAGTGTTAEACYREGMRCMLVERETEYQADIRRRMALMRSGPDERSRESIKAKTKDQAIDHGPLFATNS